jgi:UDP-2,3-diacylglucosamine pyrophosphatase LpxH
MRASLSRLKSNVDVLERTAATAGILFSSYKLAPFLADGERRGVGFALACLTASVYWLRLALRRQASRDATKAIISFAELAAIASRHDSIGGERAPNRSFILDKGIDDHSDRLRPQRNDIVKVNTLFISDLHLGTKGCQADLLIDFLANYDADTVYLVGDIIDGWHLKSRWYWPKAHDKVVQRLLSMARQGTRLVYVPGNHDDFLRAHVGSTFGGIDVVEHAIHKGADGRDYLVIHGDQFDLVVNHARWLALLGDWAYRVALTCNATVNIGRRYLGLPYWSFSAWAKLNVKNAVNYIGRFEQLLSAEAHRHAVQGVICGHIHHAVMHDDFGVRYINTGDWVESCSAVVECCDGHFEILRWAEPQSRPLTVEMTSVPQAKAAA